jgi:hypothetical protein
MKAVGRLGLAAVVVLAGACAPLGIGEDDESECPANALCEVVACVAPCASVILSATESWAGPPIPVSRQDLLGAISCMLPTEPRAEYPTRFDIDRDAQTVDFECDGEDGLHLAGHFTGITSFGDENAEGEFGPGTKLVLSATGETAEWLREVMDPAGTDLWRAYDQPPRWASTDDGMLYATDWLGILPLGANEVNVPIQATFDFAMRILSPPP